MSNDLRIAVIGATGALGKEIVAVLDQAPWRPAQVRAFARTSTSVPFVEYGSEQIAVDDVATADWSELDGAIVATPAGAGAALIDLLVNADVPVVDCSGSQIEDASVPLVVPWLTDELPVSRSRDVIAIPSAAALLLASVLRPLARAGYDGDAEAHVLLPASSFGRDGVDELSRQVVAMFNSAPPPRKVFEQGLAFDLIPQVGEVGSSGWTGAELRIVAEIFRLTNTRCAVTLTGVPVFSGISATIRLQAEAGDRAEDLVRVLQDAGIDVAAAGARRQPRPRRMQGAVYPAVARVRSSPLEDAIHLWVSMDNLRACAAAAVSAMAGRLGQRHTEAE